MGLHDTADTAAIGKSIGILLCYSFIGCFIQYLIILVFFISEGVASGQCANGFGICCVCKLLLGVIRFSKKKDHCVIVINLKQGLGFKSQFIS